MKKQTLAVSIIATVLITFISCKWFTSNNNLASSSIIGKWKVDTMYATGKDTSIGLLFYHLAKNEGDTIAVQFNADSTYKEYPSKDSVLKKYYVKEKEIFIQEDSAFISYQLTFTKDSIATLTAKDSLVIVLKKQ